MAQALADFVAKFTLGAEDKVDEVFLMVKVDGSFNKEAGGVGVILETTEKDVIQNVVWLQSPTTNNEAEYEAFLTGLKLEKSMGA